MLIYVYPKEKDISFSLISRYHIHYLRKGFNHNIAEVNESVLDHIYWTPGKRILLHPILYAVMGDRKEMFQVRKKRLDRLMEVKEKLGGFDTADTDRLSEIAARILNKMDLVMVPSNWAKDVYVNSGVKTNIEVLPHGVSDSFLKESMDIDPNLKYILDMKERDNAILILYFLTHSGFRKGADLVAKAMLDVQDEVKNAYLVVKRGSIMDPFLSILRNLKMVEVAGFLNEEQLVQLYKLCDLVIVPSRGGGFELNALEGIAAGVPTVVPDAGCFLDYINYAIPVKVEGSVRIFRDNPIHVGKGFEPSWVDLRDKILEVIRNLDYYRKRFRRNRKIVLLKYSWRNVATKLHKILKSYGFIA